MEAAQFDALREKLIRFMEVEIYPNELLFVEQCEEIERTSNEWTQPPIIVELKEKAKANGLWNLWLPNGLAELAGYPGGGLNNQQYGELCEIMGTGNHMEFAPQAMNCASPDTGNMETLARFATPAQKEKWLAPLLAGDIKSCFAMTEPEVASSDATNVQISIQKEGGQYVINGRKWWITGAGNLDCKIMILMGKTDPSAAKHAQQSCILVPMDTPGITLLRPMSVLGDVEAPKGHFDILFEDVRVPVENILAGEGRGFEIAQARLGPGRIHHCMRLMGTAERALSLLCRRATERTAFGRKLSDFDTILQDISKSRAEIDQAKMLVKHTASILDSNAEEGSRLARKELSMCKAVIPQMVQTIVDRSMQAHGAMGLSQDTFLATAFAWARWLRFADGPCEVHWRTAARVELSQQKTSYLHKIGHYQPDLSSDRVFRANAPAARGKL